MKVWVLTTSRPTLGTLLLTWLFILIIKDMTLWLLLSCILAILWGISHNSEMASQIGHVSHWIAFSNKGIMLTGFPLLVDNLFCFRCMRNFNYLRHSILVWPKRRRCLTRLKIVIDDQACFKRSAGISKWYIEENWLLL